MESPLTRWAVSVSPVPLKRTWSSDREYGRGPADPVDDFRNGARVGGNMRNEYFKVLVRILMPSTHQITWKGKRPSAKRWIASRNIKSTSWSQSPACPRTKQSSDPDESSSRRRTAASMRDWSFKDTPKSRGSSTASHTHQCAASEAFAQSSQSHANMDGQYGSWACNWPFYNPRSKAVTCTSRPPRDKKSRTP